MLVVTRTKPADNRVMQGRTGGPFFRLPASRSPVAADHYRYPPEVNALTHAQPYKTPIALEPVSRESRHSTRYPGFWLACLAGVAILADVPLGFSTIVDSVRVAQGGNLLLGATVAAGTLLFIFAHLTVLAGSVKMVHGASNRISWLAAVISCVPVISPGLLLGIPLGVRSLVALQKANTDSTNSTSSSDGE